MAIFKSMLKKTGYIKIGSQPPVRNAVTIFESRQRPDFACCLIKEAFRNGERISKRKIRLIFRNTKKNFLIQEEKQD